MKNFAATVGTKIGIVLNVLENKPLSPSASQPAFPAGNNNLVEYKFFGGSDGHLDVPCDNLLSRRQPSLQKLCSTHKYKIPSGGNSQIDGLEAGKITYEYASLLVVRKYVKTTLALG